jgi:hypothetical protein
LSWLIVSCFEHVVSAPVAAAQVFPAAVRALQERKLAIFPISGVRFLKNKLPAGLSFSSKKGLLAACLAGFLLL